MVREQNTKRNIRSILSEFNTLLDQERDALRTLDHDGIEFAATRKLELDAELKVLCEREKPTPADLSELQRMRAGALTNQLLLVHARSCLTGLLSLVREQKQIQIQGLKNPSPAPLRVNFRS